FLLRFVLVPQTFDSRKAQTSSVHRTWGIQTLTPVFWPRHQSAIVEDFRNERANIWSEASRFGEEDSLICSDCSPPIQEVAQSGGIGSRRVKAALRLIELLRISKQHNTCCCL